MKFLIRKDGLAFFKSDPSNDMISLRRYIIVEIHVEFVV